MRRVGWLVGFSSLGLVATIACLAHLLSTNDRSLVDVAGTVRLCGVGRCVCRRVRQAHWRHDRTSPARLTDHGGLARITQLAKGLAESSSPNIGTETEGNLALTNLYFGVRFFPAAGGLWRASGHG